MDFKHQIIFLLVGGMAASIAHSAATSRTPVTKEEFDGEWSAWSPWGACKREQCCDPGTQTRDRMCMDDDGDCFGSKTESRSPCVCNETFNAAVDCERCYERKDGQRFLADPCNCTQYRHCVRGPDGWDVFVRPSPPCTCFDQDTLSFVRYSGDCDTTQGPDGNNETECLLSADPKDPAQYVEMVHGKPLSRPCPPGTAFNPQDCGCTLPYNPVTTRDGTPPLVADICIDFTKLDSWGVSLSAWGWRWVGNQDVVQHPAGPPCMSGPCANFNGRSSMLQVHYLANNYPKHVAITFWVYQKDKKFGGLFTNGDCAAEGSFAAGLTDEGELEVIVRTTKGSRILSGGEMPVGEMFFIAVSYNGDQVDVYVNGDLVGSDSLTGDLLSSSCTLAIGHTVKHGYFNGYLDEVCFYADGLSQKDVDSAMVAGLVTHSTGGMVSSLTSTSTVHPGNPVAPRDRIAAQ